MRRTTLPSILFFLAALGIPQLASAAPAKSKGPEVRFEGNREIKAQRLLKVIEEDVADFRADPRPSYLDDAAFEIATQYRDLGYASVEVEFDQRPEAVVFHIQEGPRALVEELRFEGAASYSQKELASFFPSARGGLLGLDPQPF
ncbi:MAG: hypothetical protein KDD47_20485, partial [Acidobacteria bacterium]|nr:hypothetical protein [Acidobacteriota bacterium]